MLRKAFYKKTRKGKVVRIVHEKYLRSDVECGYLCGNVVDVESLRAAVKGTNHHLLIVVDTNVALRQIDILEFDNSLLSMVVIPQTVLQELRNLNLSIYRRIVALLKSDTRSFIFYPNELSVTTASLRQAGEVVNDFNDRAIVKCAQFFKDSLGDSGEVVFLTSDEANKRRALAQGLRSESMRQLVQSHSKEYPQLMDLVAADASFISSGSSGSEQQQQQYTEHLPMSELLTGLRERRYLKGTLRAKREGPHLCYVVIHSEQDEARQSVNISGKLNVNRAIDGDLVAIELVQAGSSSGSDEDLIINDEQQQQQQGAGVAEETAEPTVEAIEGLAASSSSCRSSDVVSLYGRVVGIIRRNWRNYAGSLDPATSRRDAEGDTLVQFIPVDRKIPRVWISTRRYDELRDSRLLVSIDQWPASSDLPLGHYTAVLGANGDKAVETQVLLHEFDVPHEEFSSAVMACLPPADWRITPEIVAERTDLRHLPVVSIDPPGCKDIDDALHCIRLPNGRLQAGVHIADVSYFVHPDTPIDKEAAHRSTSTYLVERRLDMLPGLLTTQLCSLRSSEDHLAFSVLWEFDMEGNIYDVSFCKSAIRSVASLTYDEAQVMLDNPVPYSEKNLQARINDSVNLLNHLALILRQRRIDAGALTLASPEVRFKLDSETQNPTDVAMYNLKQANALVEEWMLLANITVSKQTLRHYPTLAVLRRHQPPSREQFAPLLAAARAVGVSLDITSSKRLADSLDLAVRPGDAYFNKLLRVLSTRCMMPAQYFCSGEIPKDQWHHYGLAAPVYTHFTSPIRRYADVLVHRLLAASIGVIPLPPANTDRSKQQELCTHMNRRHRAAQHAQRASVNLHTLIYFRARPSIEEAYVLSVSSEGFSVIVPKFGIEGSLSCSDVSAALKCDDSHFDEEKHTLTFTASEGQAAAAKKSKKTGSGSGSAAAVWVVQVFDKVKVSIRVTEGGDNGGTSGGSDRRLVISLDRQ